MPLTAAIFLKGATFDRGSVGIFSDIKIRGQAMQIVQVQTNYWV
jgi:hypothetical protein